MCCFEFLRDLKKFLSEILCSPSKIPRYDPEKFNIKSFIENKTDFKC